ncbi:hypothetical protein H3N56_03890 [Cetobacterium sp. 2A]|uniref:hypothetical protein n=1 Tax=Cetobacterium sp. 2A TaxID=2754723 RepID=UPI00163CD1CC|nr:hypothetical protein [Cetobacterium sp. 2A]MBC2855226.1 hypothetical protein [Cetobacterium sp. 2A]MBC2855275.1 hypothetical protein [Cetobacterium sp. 2A]MBC2855639.1 hypothetical protein [Cetobacterium sp. 2A]
MAGIKGQKSGGFGGRKAIDSSEKRSITMSFRVNKDEQKIINDAKGELSLSDFILEMIKEKSDKIKKED